MHKLLCTAIIFIVAFRITEQRIHRPRNAKNSPITEKIEISRHKRIVDGDKIDIEKVPFQVLFRDDKNYPFCGGSIIAMDWVLTAGHCVCKHDGKGRKDKTFVVVSGTSHNNLGTTNAVANVICHPDFKLVDVTLDDSRIHASKNDIALIQVTQPFDINSVRQLAPLNFMQENDLIGRTVNVSGWGNIGPYPSDDTKILHGTQMIIISESECYAELAKHHVEPIDFKLAPGQICFKRTTGFGFPWFGDSGGPAVVDGTQVGILSWAFNRSWGLPNYPFDINLPAVLIATDVSAFEEWLSSYVHP